MSKAARKRNKAKRDAEKKKRKDAMRAQYAAWRDQGTNSKKQEGKKKVAGPQPRPTYKKTKTKRLEYTAFLIEKHKQKKLRKEKRNEDCRE